MIDIRFPNITAPTEAGKLQQLQSYMHQLVGQLNWALNNIGSISSTPIIVKPSTGPSSDSKDDPLSNFNSIKGLIIKSADIVKAYYEEIDNLLKLSGDYVAESDFGTFAEQTTAQVSANSKNIEQVFTDIQKINTAMEEMNIDVAAHINSGLLYYDAGVPVFGLEIGQRTEVDGVETFNKYAQFTSDKLAFFDKNGYEVAYISDRKLFITDVEITGAHIMGGFKRMIVPGKGVVTKWIGG